MKNRITRKQIYERFSTVIYATIADSQNLVSMLSPIGYNDGIYGWNYDVYANGNVAFCVGHRGMPGKRAVGVSTFNSLAGDVRRDARRSLDEKECEIMGIFTDFIQYNL